MIVLEYKCKGKPNQFCLNINVTDIQPKTGKEIGLDVGIESFYTDSNGYQEVRFV